MSDIVKFNKDNTFQRLRAHYLEPESNPISDAEKARLERVVLMCSLRMRNKYSKQQVLKKIVDDYDVSQATAYRDYTMMSNLFGEIDEVNTVAEMMFVREEYMFLYQQLIKDRDWNNARAVLDKYKETLPNINENEVDPKKIEAHEFHLKLDRQLQKLMSDALIGGGFDFAKAKFQDIDFEVIETKKVDGDKD
ncbi:Uncharacterised protein [Algoriella xinjiangensis]|uniref:hypothetical protein n=1 Tax=Algoriella xinjiangensis TaxID=684065 RepID=UPI000F63709C|nr:hypothetical protein [Algoriella xinjiangensis]VDH16867.1 Uncharacterised protein [Algoriella xinjiangensis]